MNELNIEFLEEYKRIDKLCMEMYRAEKGVTSYIDDMKNTPLHKRKGIYSWDTDFNRLMQLRKIRNQLTHEVGAWDVELCTEEDIEWLITFRQRIFDGDDPLTLAEQSGYQQIKEPIRTAEYPAYDLEDYPIPKRCGTGGIAAFLVAVLVAVVCIFFYIFRLS